MNSIMLRNWWRSLAGSFVLLLIGLAMAFAASPDGSYLPFGICVVTDSHNATWKLSPVGGGVGSICTRNGVIPAGCSDVQVLTYFGGNIYAENATPDHNWYQWNDSTSSWTQVAGDPRLVATGSLITQQPVSRAVAVGQTATFSIVAVGTSPLSYVWKKNGVIIPNATKSWYTTPATVAGDNGAQFTVVVTNSAGVATSNIATLTVGSLVAPSITTQPQNVTVTVGATATFSVTADGSPPLSYQWQKNNVNISGATGTSYTTPATVIGDNGATFRVIVTNTAVNGTVTSNSATLTVNAAVVAPSITTQPQNASVVAPNTATFSVVAAGTAPLTYVWQKNNVDIPGAPNSNSYTTPATTISDSGSTFKVKVSNSAGNVTSNSATLTVTQASSCIPSTTFPAGGDIDSSSTYSTIVSALDASLASLGCASAPDTDHGMNNVGTSNSTVIADLKQARQLIMRTSFYWEAWTDSSGAILNPDTGLDNQVVFYANQGLKSLLVISQNSASPPSGVSYSNQAAMYQTVKNFMVNMVNRYPQIVYWELFNEVDQCGTDGGQPPACVSFTDVFGSNANITRHDQGVNYANMLAVAVPAMKAANPNIKIVLGGLSDPNTSSTSFSQGIFDGGGAQYIDYWNIHVYGPIQYRVLDEGILFRTWMNAHGLSAKGLVNTEWGDLSGAQQVNECAAYHDMKKYGVFNFDAVFAFDDNGWTLFTNGTTPTATEQQCFMNNP